MMNNEIENVIKRFRVSISQEAKKVKLTKQALENTNTQQILASEDEQDKLERTLKEVFFKAKNEVANDIINKFCVEQKVFLGEIPHYKFFCTKRLNQWYGLNLVNIDTQDTMRTDVKKWICQTSYCYS